MEYYRSQPLVYFPNIIFKMIRSGKERAATEVVFRVPRALNKIDIKEYLTKLYGVGVAHVNTVNFIGRRIVTRKTYGKGYKNAIVTLKEAFRFPPVPDEAFIRSNAISESFKAKKMTEMQQKQLTK